MADAYIAKGAYTEAVAETIKGSSSPERATALREAYERHGVSGFWRVHKEFAAQDNNSFGLARFSAHLGQFKESLRWLERAYEERHPGLPRVAIDPAFDPLRTDPQFLGLMSRIGLNADKPLTSRHPSRRGPA